VRAAQKAGRITAKVQDAAFEEANSLSVITDTELALWKRARALSKEVVRVDDFDMHFGVTVAQSSGKPTASLTKYAEAAE
jgi:hypothetical protein